ncbi:Guanine nucleotide-binding protein subunit gamma 3 [Striga hermonthica]|uniref:Guanine nucleotide-binding protein subunit gamma 3 n=1 Tax=Striga hermonthica TaxID=68872 RepID=A0A9N7NS23_STRHE|nr:Guanine nucleotide-binding protein subunit gamma 3 [Striga hermonthica]
MPALKGNGTVTSLPPPEPKSPPELYGRRRELAKVQLVEREIGFLEEELKSIEGLQLASRSCIEVVDFVTANVDPLIPSTKKTRRSCRFWKWLWGKLSCFKQMPQHIQVQNRLLQLLLGTKLPVLPDLLLHKLYEMF